MNLLFGKVLLCVVFFYVYGLLVVWFFIFIEKREELVYNKMERMLF